MPRVRRNYPGSEKDKRADTRLKTAIYARLSVENNGGMEDSLENQIQFLEHYVEKSSDLSLVGVWKDNGFSGRNFRRPGWQALMEAVEEKEVTCIVVKDLSRLGRNYLEAGDYLERKFPSVGLTFIAVNDHYDSREFSQNQLLGAAIKNLAAHQYATDISGKIRAGLYARKKQGGFTGRIPPYGYWKSEEFKNTLVIDPETAAVVSLIFRWRLEGKSMGFIADSLTSMGIETPGQRLQGLTDKTMKDGQKCLLWRSSTIQDILKNPCYCGYVVESKTVPKEQWRLIKSHEGIISEEDFFRVSETNRRLWENGKMGGFVSEAFRPG